MTRKRITHIIIALANNTLLIGFIASFSIYYFTDDRYYYDLSILYAATFLGAYVVYALGHLIVDIARTGPIKYWKRTIQYAKDQEQLKKEQADFDNFKFFRNVRYYTQSAYLTITSIFFRYSYRLVTFLDIPELGELYNHLLIKSRERILCYYIAMPDDIYSPFLDMVVVTHDRFFEVVVDKPKDFSAREFRQILARRLGRYLHVQSSRAPLNKTDNGYKFFVPYD